MIKLSEEDLVGINMLMSAARVCIEACRDYPEDTAEYLEHIEDYLYLINDTIYKHTYTVPHKD